MESWHDYAVMFAISAYKMPTVKISRAEAKLNVAFYSLAKLSQRNDSCLGWKEKNKFMKTVMKL